MTYVLATVKASEQTPGDSAIMAEFPGVFTTGTMRTAMPEQGEETAKDKNYRSNLPDRAESAGRRNGEGVANKGTCKLASGLH